MRKTKKSALFQIFEKLLSNVDVVAPSGRCFYFIDGGWLLHKVVWQPDFTYTQIYSQYEQYIFRHFGRGSHIVFDGYSDRLSTKKQEQNRRTGSNSCVDLLFEDYMTPNVSQAKFLTNAKNKSRLIQRLSRVLLDHGYSITQCKEDADRSIVHTALPMFVSETTSHIVISDDVDVLTLLLHHSESSNVFMLRSFGTIKMIHVGSLQRSLGMSTKTILFLHAFSGADKTNSFYNKSKSSALNVVKKNTKLADQLQVFYDPSANIEQLFIVGELFALKLYGAPVSVRCINQYRYIKFNQINARKALNKEFQLASLPPTKMALQQHILRVYFQVQEWCGNSLNPLTYGWTMRDQCLVPSLGITEVAPKFIMEMIFCKCKKTLVKTYAPVRNLACDVRLNAATAVDYIVQTNLIILTSMMNLTVD